MGIFSKFEGKVEDTFEGAANKMFDSPISPVQIAKKAEKKMRREKMVGAGKQYAPTLYTVLVNAEDDRRLFGYYPTLAGETETYLSAKAVDEGLVMDGQPLVRFIVDESLKKGKFEIIAELVASPIIEQLRAEEMDRYGISNGNVRRSASPMRGPQNARFDQPQQQIPHNAPVQGYANDYDDLYDDPRDNNFDQNPIPGKPPLPYVPEDEIDYSIDYGEYTFDSQDFEDYRQNGPIPSGTFRRNSQDIGYDQEDSVDPLYRRTSEPFQAAPGMAVNMSEQAIDAARRAQVPSQPLVSPSVQPPAGVPNTVVFAAGSGNAQPSPNNAQVRACLMNTTDNRTFDLATARLLLGRDKSNDIVVDDINASRNHAELKREPQGVWVITDLGSTNGTLVNGREVTSQVLRDGDYITIGMTNYVFIQA